MEKDDLIEKILEATKNSGREEKRTDHSLLASKTEKELKATLAGLTEGDYKEQMLLSVAAWLDAKANPSLAQSKAPEQELYKPRPKVVGSHFRQ